MQRNQMRMVGMIGSNFGLVIFTGALKGILEFQGLETISDRFLIFLRLSFVVGFTELGFLALESIRVRCSHVFQKI